MENTARCFLNHSLLLIYKKKHFNLHVFALLLFSLSTGLTIVKNIHHSLYYAFAYATSMTVLLIYQEFEMDSEIKKQLLAQKDAKIEAVQKEMLRDEARHVRALEKLQSR